MPYKTIPIKLLKPTANKRQVLDDAIERYSNAFEAILRIYQERYGAVPGPEVPKKPDNDMLLVANGFHAKPFKDALNMDISAVLKTYRSTFETKRRSSYPVCRTYEKDITDQIVKAQKPDRQTVNRVLDKYHNHRTLLFCRYDARRDYSLLKDVRTGRVYAKLYLLELKDGVEAAGEPGGTLRYLLPGGGEKLLEEGKKRRRYLLFPLEMGQWSADLLQKMENGLAVPKSASLYRKNGNYYLNIRLWFEPTETLACHHFLGLSRGIKKELYCAVTDAKGDLIEEKSIGADGVNGINRLHLLSNEVLKMALKYRCRIVMGGRKRIGDGLRTDEIVPPLSPTEYRALFSLLSYKTEFAGLEKPVAVSSHSIFYRCPVCGSVRRVNRWGSDKFLCVKCGFCKELELVGALNLAGTLKRYKDNRITVSCQVTGKNITFRCPLLNLIHTCPNNEEALADFFRGVQNYMETIPPKADKKRESILRRLSEAENLKDCFYFEMVI